MVQVVITEVVLHNKGRTGKISSYVFLAQENYIQNFIKEKKNHGVRKVSAPEYNEVTYGIDQEQIKNK